ncbi:MAG: hypothetical protein ACFFB2_15075 [Promethearchaeota archaeon]
MKKEEFLTVLNEKRQIWKRKLELYSIPDIPQFYGILATVSLLDYVISLAEELEC